MTLILIVGAADTGRAPLAAGLLRRALADRGLSVEVASAGVLDHTGDEMQTEAQLALEHFGGVAEPHQARLLTPEIAAQAAVLLAIDRGTGRVIAARHPDLLGRLLVLPEIAHDRDVPDPFHMSLDRWIIYGRTLKDQLEKALPGVLSQVKGSAPEAPADSSAPVAPAAPEQPVIEAERPAAPAQVPERPAAQLRRILLVLETAPEIVDWERGRQALLEALTRVGAQAAPGDMAPAVVALLHGLLAQQSALPSRAQIGWLVTLGPLLEQPIDALTMARIAGDATKWSS